MNVGRTAGISDRFDGPEVILTRARGQKAAEALEVRVSLVLVGTASVDVDAVAVALPNLDQSVPDRIAFGIENLATQVGHLADGGGDGVVDDQEIVVGVEGEF